ncbi:MAG: UxaA family hydrolase [Promethearchaeota archaeon]
MKDKFIVMHKADNCATSLEDISKDTEIQINEKILTLNHDIPLGHKFAISNINKGELVIKYGEVIGIATENISKGDWIHIHNIKSHYLEEVVK